MITHDCMIILSVVQSKWTIVPAGAGNKDLGQFYSERFCIPVPQELVDEILLPFLSDFRLLVRCWLLARPTPAHRALLSACDQPVATIALRL